MRWLLLFCFSLLVRAALDDAPALVEPLTESSVAATTNRVEPSVTAETDAPTSPAPRSEDFACSADDVMSVGCKALRKRIASDIAAECQSTPATCVEAAITRLDLIVPSNSSALMNALDRRLEELCKGLLACVNRRRCIQQIERQLRSLFKRGAILLRSDGSVLASVAAATNRVRDCKTRSDCFLARGLAKMVGLQRRLALQLQANVLQKAKRNGKCGDRCKRQLERLRSSAVDTMEGVQVMTGDTAYPAAVIAPGFVLESIIFLSAVALIVLGLHWKGFRDNRHYPVLLACIAGSAVLQIAILSLRLDVSDFEVDENTRRLLRVVFDRLQLILLLVTVCLFLHTWVRGTFEAVFHAPRAGRALSIAAIVTTAAASTYCVIFIVLQSLVTVGILPSSVSSGDETSTVLVVLALAYAVGCCILSIVVLVTVVRAGDQPRRVAAARMVAVLVVVVAGITLKAARIIFSSTSDVDHVSDAWDVLAGYSIANFFVFGSFLVIVALTLWSGHAKQGPASDGSTTWLLLDEGDAMNVPARYEL